MLNFLIIVLIGVSLSLDAFSLSILYGTIINSNKKIYLLSSIVGIYHFFMPLFGNMIGFNIINRLPISADMIVGIILILISIQMIFSHQEIVYLQSISSFFIFGLTVSIDSFSVGIGISNITNKYVVSYLIFSMLSFLFTYIGLKFGKYLNNKFGSVATRVGAIILMIIGLTYIF